jgi:hypothetical protein
MSIPAPSNGANMVYRSDEELEKIIQAQVRQRNLTAIREGCPDEDSLAAYLTGSISAREKNALEEHFASCEFCLTEVAAANEAGESTAKPRVPRWLMERATALVESRKQEGVFDLVVRFVKDSVELVRQSGDWITVMAPQPVTVRGTAAPDDTGILQMKKEMDGHRVTVEMERVESGACQLVLKVTAADGKPGDGLRVSLMAGDREQASYLTRQGQAIFENITRGSYTLVISRGGTGLGKIEISIEVES